MTNKNFKFIGLALLLILFIPVVFYIINFHDSSISTSSSDWGTFGDFYGGMMNPLIAVINVLALIYLTIRISEIDESNKNKDIDDRKEAILDEIRLTGYKELTIFYLKLMKVLAKNNPVEESDAIIYKLEFHGMIFPYIDLFDTFENLARINELGNRLLFLEKNHDEEYYKNTILDFGRLLSDMRIDIKTITTVHKPKSHKGDK